MPIRAIVFDIGGVLELMTDSGSAGKKWEQILQLKPGELDKRMQQVWHDGSLGLCTEEDVYQRMGEIMGMNRAQVDAFWEDAWRDYLGVHNVELAAYFASLRPRYKTAILSNSFVGAREREQAAYQFEDITDMIIYSHEVGLRKPDARIYELTWQRLGVQPEEMIFLDDVEAIVEAARACGIHGVVFKESKQAIADIEAILQANSD